MPISITNGNLTLSQQGRTYSVDNDGTTVDLSRGRGDWSPSRSQDVMGIREDDGSYVVLLKQELGRTTRYFEQSFNTTTGRSEGRLSRLDAAEAFELETAYGLDIDGDGNVGAPAPTEVFSNGTLRVVESFGRLSIDMDDSDNGNEILLTAGRGSDWSLPEGATIIGLRADGADYRMVLSYEDGGQTLFEEVGISNGRVAPRATQLDGPALKAAELAYDTDFDGDENIGDTVTAVLSSSVDEDIADEQRYEDADNGGVHLMKMDSGALVVTTSAATGDVTAIYDESVDGNIYDTDPTLKVGRFVGSLGQMDYDDFTINITEQDGFRIYGESDVEIFLSIYDSSSRQNLLFDEASKNMDVMPDLENGTYYVSITGDDGASYTLNFEGIEGAGEPGIAVGTAFSDLEDAVTLTDGTDIWTPTQGEAIAVRTTDTGYAAIVEQANGWSEQHFDATGNAAGRAQNVSQRKLVQLETAYDQDFDGNGTVGDIAFERLDPSLRTDGGAPSLYRSAGDSLFLFDDGRDLAAEKTPITATLSALVRVFEQDPDMAQALSDLLVEFDPSGMSASNLAEEFLNTDTPSFAQGTAALIFFAATMKEDAPMSWLEQDLRDALIARLDVKSAQLVVDHMNGHVAEAQTNVAAAEADVAAAGEAVTSAQSAVNGFQATITDANAAIQYYQGAVAQIQTEITSRESIRSDLVTNQAQFQASADTQQAIIDQKLQEQTALSEQPQSVERDAQIAVLTAEIEAATQSRDGSLATVQSYQGSIDSIDNSVLTKQANIQQYEATIAAYEAARDHAQTGLSTAQSDLNSATIGLGAAEADLALATNDLIVAQSDLTQATDHLTTVTDAAGNFDGIPALTNAQIDALGQALSSQYGKIPYGEGTVYDAALNDQERAQLFELLEERGITNFLVDGMVAHNFKGLEHDEETDAGNTLETATALAFGTSIVRGEITGDTSGTNDALTGTDAYMFTVRKDATVTIGMTRTGYIDPLVHVFNAAGQLIGRDDDGGSGYNSELTLDLSAGDYYVTASSFASAPFLTGQVWQEGDQGPNPNDDYSPDSPLDARTPIIGWSRGPEYDDDEGSYTLTFSEVPKPLAFLLTDGRGGDSWDAGFADGGSVIGARALDGGDHAVLIERTTGVDTVWYEQHFGSDRSSVGRLQLLDVAEAEAAYVTDLDGDNLIDLSQMVFSDDYATPLGGLTLAGETVRMTSVQFSDLNDAQGITGQGTVLFADNIEQPKSLTNIGPDIEFAFNQDSGVVLRDEYDEDFVLRAFDTYLEAAENAGSTWLVYDNVMPRQLMLGTENDDVPPSEPKDEVLIGYAGADEFTFGDVVGNDVIPDFVSGEDTIAFTDPDTGFEDMSIATRGGDSIITSDAFEGSITLIGVTDLSSSDFAGGF